MRVYPEVEVVVIALLKSYGVTEIRPELWAKAREWAFLQNLTPVPKKMALRYLRSLTASIGALKTVPVEDKRS